MSNLPEDPPPAGPRQWQPRFGLGSLLLVTFVFSVMGAGGYYFVQATQGGRGAQFGFILFTLASPLLLAVVVSLLLAGSRALKR